MKKISIILMCLFLLSCASIDKKSEVPNPAVTYIEKVKKDPLNEVIDWWIVIDILQDVSFD